MGLKRTGEFRQDAVRIALPGRRIENSLRGEEHQSAFSIGRMCHVMGVSTRGLRAFCSRPASRRQRGLT